MCRAETEGGDGDRNGNEWGWGYGIESGDGTGVTEAGGDGVGAVTVVGVVLGMGTGMALGGYEAQGFCWCGIPSQLRFSWGDSQDPLLRLWFWEKKHGRMVFLGVFLP